MILGDARSGKLADNITGFGRALRRAGLPMDASRISLAIESAAWVGLDRKADLEAALQSVMVSREQDLEVFAQMFSAYFRNPELTKQLLSQMLPKAAGEALPCHAKHGCKKPWQPANHQARPPSLLRTKCSSTRR